MKAILTHVLPPTNTKPARIKATAEGVETVVISRAAYAELDTAHRVAAESLAERHGWLDGDWVLVDGTLPNGDVAHVFVRKGTK